MIGLGLLLSALAWPVPARGPDAQAVPTPEQVRQAVDRGLEYLVQSQNPDGSWGGQGDSLTTWSGDVWPNPETHRAWKVATTGLCAAALLEVGTSDPEASMAGANPDRVHRAAEAADRAVQYLIANCDVKRPSEWDTMHNWAHIYGLQGLAVAYRHPRYADSPLRPQIAQAAATLLRNLAKGQSLHGGFGYLEFDEPRTRQPQWGTSFMTGAAVVAMAEAQRSGFEVDPGLLGRSVRIIKHCRLPNGGYSYHVRTVPYLHSEYIDQVKGSLSRIEVCQAALQAAGQDVPIEDVRTGLGHFFRQHKFLDLALHKPVPHEAYYYNSGYFYLFGHYYASRVIETLPAEEQSQWWGPLQREITKLQQSDGSIWDYDMHRYDRPYGVAFSVMALGRSVGDAPAAAPAPAVGHTP